MFQLAWLLDATVNVLSQIISPTGIEFVILCTGSKKDSEAGPGMLYRLFEHLYAPFLMKKWVRAAVIVLFFGWACSSVAVVPKIEIGLDQEISMPDNSFMLKYFTFLKVRESEFLNF